MPKEKTKSAAVGLEADLHNDTEQDIAVPANEASEQDIAALAYELWQSRGCPAQRTSREGNLWLCQLD